MTVDEGVAQRALVAFRISCPSLMRRKDGSLLTATIDWQPVCTAASTVVPGGAAAFFRDNFEWDRLGEGKLFATGYYEPEIAGTRVAQTGYAVPVYRTPPDLVRCTRADGTSGRGRLDPVTSQCLPYYTRAEIEDGVLANKGLELGWAADPVDLFFVEIQGSGRLVDPAGNVVRIGYDNQNGQTYVAIGKLLRDRGILPPGGANMEAIKAWLRANPDQGRALMRENLSYIFFKELTGTGPLGALGVPVTAQATVAADPLYTPLGAPVFVQADRPEINGLWVAQDVGGAIKGANRFDTFWGAGADATRIAGGMAAKGQALLLLPKGSAAKALAARAATPPAAASAQAQP
ncbi:murein transglycosylase A [Sphingomonas ginkgonis]|nr:MltA domain-containing protein [Sphingomonas ginkgonis]